MAIEGFSPPPPPTPLSLPPPPPFPSPPYYQLLERGSARLGLVKNKLVTVVLLVSGDIINAFIIYILIFFPAGVISTGTNRMPQDLKLLMAQFK